MNLNENLVIELIEIMKTVPYCFLLTIKAAVVRQSCQLFTQRHFWRRLPALHGTGQNLQLIHRHNLLSIKNSDGDAEFVSNGRRVHGHHPDGRLVRPVQFWTMH